MFGHDNHDHHNDDETEILKQILCALEANNAELRLIAAEQIASKQLLQTIVNNTTPRPTSRIAKVLFKGASIMANDLVLNVGQTSTATPTTFLADGTTPAGATISAAVYTFTDPSAAVVSSDGITALVTAVAPSTAGAVSGSVSFTATDTDSAVSQWTVPFTVFVNAPVPPAQLSQSAGITFSTPA